MRISLRGGGGRRDPGGRLPLLRCRGRPPRLLGPGGPVQAGEGAGGGSKAGAPERRAPGANEPEGRRGARSTPTGSGEGVSGSRSERRERLVEVYRKAAVCELCPLSETRTNVVFGAANADADLMFVGEAPGAEEDRQGLPFVGRAGALLTELLAGIGLQRSDVWITNVLRCRPPGNRDPQPVEIESCQPYTLRQLDLIQPKVVATLGNFATKLLTGNRAGITRVRGTPQVHELGSRTVFVMPLLHPAAALRTPSLVDTLREDSAKLPELIEHELPGPRPAPAELAASVAESAADQLDLFA